MSKMSKIGIDAFGFYVPSLYVSMNTLAQHRGIAVEKLNRGLGLNKMSVPDVNEDAASFAANALLNLFQNSAIDPRSVGRIYLGTESALDASKPTATYAIEVVEEYFSTTYGERCFKNCDVLDMTFACIGAVDALHNSLDWVKGDSNRKAIVIASDLSKYELHSTGEYTQGAGAVAMLITHDPAILSINDYWGVATKSEGDFFKPRRTYKKAAIIKDVISQLEIDKTEQEIEDLMATSDSEFWSDPNKVIEVFKEEPVFDGQFSNACYSDRITEALDHFSSQKPLSFLNDWQHIIFHLPYAFHGRRIIFDNWLSWIKSTELYNLIVSEYGPYTIENQKEWLKSVSKSPLYKEFVAQKIAPGEKASSDIGNMYTASIFMSLLSMLSVSFNEERDISNDTVGFIAYGSGSKSKVFEAKIESSWKSRIASLKLFETLNNRFPIDIETYEKLHNNALNEHIEARGQVLVSHIATEENKKGLRLYSKS